MHPYDLILTGLALDLVGSLMLAKGFALKRPAEILRDARGQWDLNQALVRTGLLQKTEAAIGGALLGLGFLGQIWANFHGGPAANELGWISSWQRFLLVLTAVVLLAWVAVKLGHAGADRRFSDLCRESAPENAEAQKKEP